MSRANKEKEGNLKIERLKYLLEYNTTTGLFHWIAKSSPKSNYIRIGDRAGCLDKQGRIVITIDGAPFKAHRLAWFYHYGVWPANVIDHINGNSVDNSIGNLRDVPNRTNMENASKYKRADPSLPQGVIAVKGNGVIIAYRAHWTDINGKTWHAPAFNIKKLGSESSAIAAAKAQRKQMIEHRIAEGAEYTDRHGLSLLV